MKKWIIVLMVFFLLPTQIYAHTHLETSSPKDGETVTEPMTEILLKFDTHIEEMSSFTLVNEQGEEISSEQTVDHDTMKGVLQETLPSGSYTLEWKIVGADGHVMEEGISFTVDVAHEENDNHEQVEVTNETNEVKNTSIEETEGNTLSWISIIMVVVGGVVLLLLMLLVLRRRKS